MPARRAPGEGSIYQRPDGLWCARLDITQPGMPRRRKAIYGKTRQQVQREMAKLRREYERAGDLPTATLTVEAWLNHWLDDIAPERVAPTTLPGYRSKVRNYIIPAIGRHRLDKLRPEHLRAMYRGMGHLSQNTRRQTHAILARALKVAVREGKVARNVAELIDAPPQEIREPVSLAPEHITAILEHIAGTPSESRWLAALTLGMRQGECLALRWEMVDLDVGTIEVAEALARLDGRHVVKAPKSRMSARVIPLPMFALDALRARHRDYQAERQVDGYDERGLVWGRLDGRPRDAKRDWREWVDLLEAAGVPRVRLHDARHSAATSLMMLGVPLPVISAILGHAHIQTTMRYVHADLTAAQAAMAMLDERRRALEP